MPPDVAIAIAEITPLVGADSYYRILARYDRSRMVASYEFCSGGGAGSQPRAR
jgi:hypothetical protein